MFSLRTQGKIPKENQVCALHVYIDKLDVNVVKPRLLAVYAGNASADHLFPLHIRMRLLPEIDSVLNMQDQCKIDKLWACQATCITSKLITLKTWEIEFLDKTNKIMGVSLQDAMMFLKHPTKKDSLCSILLTDIGRMTATWLHVSSQQTPWRMP